MYITTDIWLHPDITIEPNATNTGLSIHPADDHSQRVTLYFGSTLNEIEDTRTRINLAIDRALDAREEASP